MISLAPRLLTFSLLLGAGICSARPAGSAYSRMSDAQVSSTIATAHAVEPLGARVQAVSEPFLGTPYVLGNMGEGPDGDGRDKDPRYNVKSADCTTFVEHALAFALAADLPQARALLDKIRYDHGQVGYGKRRHFTDAQWIPGLEAEGYLEDATAQVAGSGGVLTSTVHLDAQLLAASAHEELKQKLRPDEVPVGTFSVPYVPLAQMGEAAGRLEAGMVINVVKAEKPGLLTRISHQGLIVKKGGAVMVRNATSVGAKAVVDEPLAEFVDRQGRAKSWPTVGFNFQRLKLPAPAQ